MTAIDIDIGTGFFCHLPFTEIHTDGKIAAPCCVFRPETEIELDGYASNREMLAVKTALLQKNAPKQCQTCVEQEKNSTASFRILANQFHEDLAKQVMLEGWQYQGLENLSITTSNICNLKCLPCENSSYVRSQELHQLGFKKKPAKKHISHQFDSIFSMFPRTLTFTGGEPFYDNTWTILQGFVDNGKSQQIALDINTNLTAITKDKLDFIIDNFKSVSIKGSIDGVGDVNNYLRYPSDWSIIEATVDSILARPKLNFVITTALSNLSLLRYHEIVAWAQERKIKDLFISQVSTPEVLSCKNFFAEHAPRCRQNLETLSTLPNISNRTKYCLDLCVALCNNTENNMEHRAKIKNYLDLHDAKRKTSWSKVFPELQL